MYCCLVLLAGAALLPRAAADYGRGRRCAAGHDVSSTYDVTYYSSIQGRRGAGLFTFAILQTPDADECAEAASSLATLADPCCGLTSDATSISLVLDSKCAHRSLASAQAWVRTGVNGSRRALDVEASGWRRGSAVLGLDGLRGLGVATQLVEVALPAANPCAARAGASVDVAPGPWPCPQAGCAFELTLRSNIGVFADYLSSGAPSRTSRPDPRLAAFNRDACCVVAGTAEVDVSNYRPESVTADTQQAWATGSDLSAAPVRFLVVGDWGANHTGLQALNNERGQLMVARAMEEVAAKRRPQFVINTGDNVYESGLSGAYPSPEQYMANNWGSVYNGDNLKDLHWYSVAGNHDHFHTSLKIVDLRWWRNQALAPLGCRQENVTFDTPGCRGSRCCYSQAWQWSQYLPSEPRWHMQGGFWSFTPPTNGPSNDTVQFFLFDSNPYIDSYFTSDSTDAFLPEGLAVWRAKINDTEASLLDAIAKSTAKWKIVVAHHTLRNYGTHCTGTQGEKDCANMQALRAKLEALKVPLYLNGHDHSVQVLRLDSGMHCITSGAGAKRNAIYPGDGDLPPDDLLYPRNRSVWGGYDVIARVKAPYGFVFVAAWPDRVTYEVYEVWRPSWFPLWPNAFSTQGDTRLAFTYTLRK